MYRRRVRTLCIVLPLLVFASRESRGETLGQMKAKFDSVTACMRDTTKACLGLSRDDRRSLATFLQNYSSQLSILDRNAKGDPRTASLSFSFSGDDSRDRSQYNIGTGIEISDDAFPNRMTFKTKSDVQIQDGKLIEDVSTVTSNYNAYLQPWLEAFGFIERFSDTYLGIDQRYEVGPGLKLDIVFGGWSTRTGRMIRDSLDLVRQRPKDVPELVRLQTLTGDVGTFDLLERLQEAERIPRASVRKQHAILATGLSTSIFAELQQVHVNAFFDSVGAIQHDPTKVSVTAAGRYRWAIRPSVEFRPLESSLIRVLYYFKLPVTGDYYVAGRRDYRNELYVIGEVQLPGDKIELDAGFNDTYINVTPTVPLSAVPAGHTLRHHDSPHRHQAATFALKLKF